MLIRQKELRRRRNRRQEAYKLRQKAAAAEAQKSPAQKGKSTKSAS